MQKDLSSTEPQSYAPLHAGCGCLLHSRRRFGCGLLAATAGLVSPGVFAREGVEVGKRSQFTKFVSAENVERAAVQNYNQLKQKASAQRTLAPDHHPQVIRLRAIAQRLIPFSEEWNPRARGWRWEVNLIVSNELNAFCMPAGKIAFYSGILDRLQLSDAEVAMVMGHEMAHALREHGREQMGKAIATRGAIDLAAQVFGVKDTGRLVADIGGQLLALRFGREDESEADLIGLELGARGGYDPNAAVTLWQKMSSANKGSVPEFISTHPSGPHRIRDLQSAQVQVAGLYERAPKPAQNFGPSRGQAD